MSSIPSLRLFPLYPGGPVVQTDRGDADRSFTIPATEFNQAYTVNGSGGDTFTLSNSQFYLDSQGRLQAGVSQTNFNPANTAFSITGDGRVQSASIPTRAPTLEEVVPSQYWDRVASFSYNEKNLGNFLAMDKFVVPSGSMGIEYTTDGSGGIASSRIVSNTQTMMAGNELSSSDLPNRADILRVSAPTNPSNDAFDGLPPFSPNSGAVSRLDNTPGEFLLEKGLFQLALPGRLGSLDSTRPISSPFSVDFGSSNTGAETNPILQRLKQLQPPDLGLTIAGANSALSVEAAKQFATVNAGFGLPNSETLQQNVNALRDSVVLQQQAYAQQTLQPFINGMMTMLVNYPAAQIGLEQNNNPFAAAANQPRDLNLGMGDESLGKGSGGGTMPMATMTGGQNNQASGQGTSGLMPRKPFSRVV